MYSSGEKVVEWEYRTIWVSDDKQLNVLGVQGWELVAAMGTPGNNYKAIFKRKVVR